MDKTLERILSLLPRKADGKIKHGAKAEFARSIGYDSGDIVSMWENGSSASYRGKLHEIAAKYGVSVEWLRGETDDEAEMQEYLVMLQTRPECRKLLSSVKGATREEVEAYIKIIEGLRTLLRPSRTE